MSPVNTPVPQQQSKPVTLQRMDATFSGPIPPSAEFERYNQILPGAAERLLSMAEKDLDHRIDVEKKTVKYEYASYFLGQIFSFAICTMALLAAGMCFYLGQSVYGLVSLLGTFTLIVYAFKENRKSKDNQPS